MIHQYVTCHLYQFMHKQLKWETHKNQPYRTHTIVKPLNSQHRSQYRIILFISALNEWLVARHREKNDLYLVSFYKYTGCQFVRIQHINMYSVFVALSFNTHRENKRDDIMIWNESVNVVCWWWPMCFVFAPFVFKTMRIFNIWRYPSFHFPCVYGYKSVRIYSYGSVFY